MEIFNIGIGEMIVIALIALIVLGPERLPEFARKAGKMMGDLRRAINDVNTQIQQEIQVLDEPVRELRESLNPPDVPPLPRPELAPPSAAPLSLATPEALLAPVEVPAPAEVAPPLPDAPPPPSLNGTASSTAEGAISDPIPAVPPPTITPPANKVVHRES